MTLETAARNYPLPAYIAHVPHEMAVAKLRAEAKEVESQFDPAVRLLQYQALEDCLSELYDPKNAPPKTSLSTDRIVSPRERAVEIGGFVGQGAGMLGGVAAAATATALLGGIILPVVATLTSVIGIGLAGYSLGRKLASATFSRRHKPEQNRANDMLELHRDVYNKVLALQEPQYIGAIARSPYFKDVKKIFPGMAATFNRYAEKQMNKYAAPKANVPKGFAP